MGENYNDSLNECRKQFMKWTVRFYGTSGSHSQGDWDAWQAAYNMGDAVKSDAPDLVLKGGDNNGSHTSPATSLIQAAQCLGLIDVLIGKKLIARPPTTQIEGWK